MRHPLLRTMSTIWVAFVATVPVLVVVTLLAGDRTPELPVILPAVLVVSVGVATIVAVVALERMLAASPPADLDAAFATVRARRLTQWAVSEAPMMLAIALALVLGPPWVVAVGASGTLCALAIARPGAASLERLDRAWQAAGSPVSLARELEHPTSDHH